MVENRTTIQITEELRQKLKQLAGKRDMNYQELLADMVQVFEEIDPGKSIISIPKKLSIRISNSIKGTDIKTTSEWSLF